MGEHSKMSTNFAPLLCALHRKRQKPHPRGENMHCIHKNMQTNMGETGKTNAKKSEAKKLLTDDPLLEKAENQKLKEKIKSCFGESFTLAI